MAQTTEAERRMTRGELATYLREIADSFDGDEETVTVDVGNKTVTLSPPEELDCEVEISERSSVVRGTRETIDLRITWKR